MQNKKQAEMWQTMATTVFDFMSTTIRTIRALDALIELHESTETDNEKSESVRRSKQSALDEAKEMQMQLILNSEECLALLEDVVHGGYLTA